MDLEKANGSRRIDSIISVTKIVKQNWLFEHRSKAEGRKVNIPTQSGIEIKMIIQVQVIVSEIFYEFIIKLWYKIRLSHLPYFLQISLFLNNSNNVHESSSRFIRLRMEEKFADNLITHRSSGHTGEVVFALAFRGKIHLVWSKDDSDS